MRMITVSFRTDNKTPLYMQLYNHIKQEIESGALPCGEKLPSKRALSAHLKISIVTVETAYSQLLAEGYITSRPGSGFYVEELLAVDQVSCVQEKGKITTETELIRYDFHTNRIDISNFPFSTWAKLSRAVLSEQSDDLLNACHPQGTMALRTEIASYLKAFRGMTVSPEQIVVGAGTEYLTGLMIQLLGRNYAYGVENPGYHKIYQIFSANTARVFPIPMDEKGASAETIAGFGINVLHITPSHHFPLGIVMPISRRQELLRWANAREDRYIIEDDYDSEFRYAGRPIPTLQSMDKNGKVIYINTFTKSLAPSMRISYMVLPESLCHQFSTQLGFYSCTVSVIEQLTLAQFMKNGHFDRHINRMKKIYRQRRDILCKAIADSRLNSIVRISGGEAGMHLLLTVENGMNQNALLSAAAKEGVKIYGLSEYYAFPVSNMPDNIIIAGFSGLNERQLLEGAAALERAWLPTTITSIV